MKELQLFEHWRMKLAELEAELYRAELDARTRQAQVYLDEREAGKSSRDAEEQARVMTRDLWGEVAKIRKAKYEAEAKVSIYRWALRAKLGGGSE